jgi:hypothetical protein
MPKGRNYYKRKKQAQQDKYTEIQKRSKEYLDEKTPDDQTSLFDRLGNQDPRVREMAYITLSTIDINPTRGLTDEIFNDEMTKRIVKSLDEPIKKNALCVFAAISNVLNTADLHNKSEVLESFFKFGLLDIHQHITKIAQELTDNFEKVHNSDFEKSLLYIENAFKLLDTVAVLESICVDENLEFISQHEGILETSIQIMISKECDYIKADKIWVNEATLYWVSHFLYSLTKENPALCDKLKGVKDIEGYVTSVLSNIDESNVHICSNLSGLSFNLCLEEFLADVNNSEVYAKLVHVPITKVLIGMNTPQYEFNQSFAENMEHIKEALSGENEDEESINTDNKPSSTKLALMMSDFLNGMSSQVTKWKNFALGNVNSLEILSQILQEIGKNIHNNFHRPKR